MTHSVRLSDQGEALAAIFSAQNGCAVDKFLSRLVEKQLTGLCHDALGEIGCSSLSPQKRAPTARKGPPKRNV